MSTQIKKNGNWVTVAGGTRMWVGTKAALQAALDAGELVDGTAVMVTDDYDYDEAGNTTYSEIETVIGKYVDGKPVYRKVIAKDYVMTTDGTGADTGKVHTVWTDPDGGKHGIRLGRDFGAISALSIDTLVNVGGVVKIDNTQQWNITPGIGHQSIIAAADSLTTKNYGYVPKVAAVHTSVDGMLRFWLFDPEVVLHNNPPRTYKITMWVEYTKTTN